MRLTTADLAFQDVIDGHLNIRNAPSSGDDDPDDEAAAFLRGDPGPALELQRQHEARIRARAAATPEERARAMRAAGESLSEIGRVLKWSRRRTYGFFNATGFGPGHLGKRGQFYKKVGRPPIDNLAAREMRKAGAKLKEIAAKLECSVQRVSEICGTDKRHTIPKERILSLRALGWTFRAIQKACNVSTRTVQKTIEEAPACV